MSEEVIQVLDTMRKFNNGFKYIRRVVEEMGDEELIALYELAKDLGNVSWLIRCIVIGTAHSRAPKKDDAIQAIAKEFGITGRMAYIDLEVYSAFIRDNPDFEAELPAHFYQIAAKTEAPEAAIGIALERRAERPSFTAAEFRRVLKGEMEKQPAPKGFYMLVPMDISKELFLEEKKMDGHGETELYHRGKVSSIAGQLYMDIK